MVKKCPRCKQLLHDTEFNWKIKDVRLAAYCKNCSRKYVREHYVKNRAYYLVKARKRNKEIKKKAHNYIGSYLQSHPCIDCGETDILVLEFDHRDRSSKTDCINRIISSGNYIKQIEKEVSKCDVRCANCHRRKTVKETNSWRTLYAPVA